MVTKPKISIREMVGLFAMMSDVMTYEEWLKNIKEYCEENNFTLDEEDAKIVFETFED
jgi:dihydroneopterin aldolase